MIELVRQPADAGLCGQACVAMIAGVSLQAAITAVGHARRNGSNTRELAAGLQRLGVRTAGNRLRALRGQLPERALIALRRNGERNPYKFHWMLQWDGAVYDPDDLWPGFYSDWRITSYLRIL